MEDERDKKRARTEPSTNENPPTTMADVPTEILRHIASFLESVDLWVVGAVNHAWRAATTDHPQWNAYAGHRRVLSRLKRTRTFTPREKLSMSSREKWARYALPILCIVCKNPSMKGMYATNTICEKCKMDPVLLAKGGVHKSESILLLAQHRKDIVKKLFRENNISLDPYSTTHEETMHEEIPTPLWVLNREAHNYMRFGLYFDPPNAIVRSRDHPDLDMVLSAYPLPWLVEMYSWLQKRVSYFDQLFNQQFLSRLSGNNEDANYVYSRYMMTQVFEQAAESAVLRYINEGGAVTIDDLELFDLSKDLATL